MKKKCELFLCALLLLCLLGCGAGADNSELGFEDGLVSSLPADSAESSLFPAAQHAPSVSGRKAQRTVEDHTVGAIKTRGTLTVAMVEENPPFTFFNDDASREGLDNAIANTIAEELGVVVEVYSGTQEQVVEAVRKGRVDVALGGFSAGDTALKGTVETGYYAGGKQVLLCCVEDVRLYPTIASFDTKTIGYLEDRAEQRTILKELFPSCQAKEVRTVESGLRKLRSGTCAALMLDEFQGIAYAQDTADLGLATPKLETEILVEPKVMVVMAGNESLANFINEFVIKKYTLSGGLGRLMISATTKATNLKLLKE